MPAQLLMGDGRCQGCREFEPEFDRAVSFGEYAGALRGLIHLLKYDKVLPAAPVLGGLLAEANPATRARRWRTIAAVAGASSSACQQTRRTRIQPGRADCSLRGEATAAATGDRVGFEAAEADALPGGADPRRARRQHARRFSRYRPDACEGQDGDRRRRRDDDGNDGFRVCPRAEESRGRASLGSDGGPHPEGCGATDSCRMRNTRRLSKQRRWLFRFRGICPRQLKAQRRDTESHWPAACTMRG